MYDSYKTRLVYKKDYTYAGSIRYFLMSYGPTFLFLFFFLSVKKATDKFHVYNFFVLRMTFYLSKSNCGRILAWILSPRLVKKKKKCIYIYGVILWSLWTIVLLYIIMHVSHCIPFLFPKVLVPIANSYLSCSPKKKFLYQIVKGVA
jgi:hypothetical protein